jgi:hypothetical protein
MLTLLIGNPLARAEDIESHHRIISQKSTVSFEQLDRIPVVTLKKVNTIESGLIPPQLFHHSAQVIAQYSKALLPNGTLNVVEPCLKH